MRRAGGILVLAATLTVAGCVAPGLAPQGAPPAAYSGVSLGLEGDELIIACTQAQGISGEFTVASTPGQPDQMIPGPGITVVQTNAVNACIRAAAPPKGPRVAQRAPKPVQMAAPVAAPAAMPQPATAGRRQIAYEMVGGTGYRAVTVGGY